MSHGLNTDQTRICNNDRNELSSCPICQRELSEADAEVTGRMHCEQAQASLRQAQSNGSYTDYNRAVFGFTEALKVNDRNETAREGLGQAQKGFAETALGKGDFELGLAVADAANPDHAGVIATLRAAQHERDARTNALKMAKRAGLVAAVSFVAVISVAMVLVLQQKQRADDRANQALAIADQARDEAVRAEQAEQLARQQLAEALAKP